MYSSKSIINSQPEEVWAELNSRFINHDVKYENVLSEQLFTYLNNKATAAGTNIGYVLASVITTANYLTSKNHGSIEIRNGYSINLNTFFLFVGQPSTGKSPAIKMAVNQPLKAIQEDTDIISNTTTSGLTKCLCTRKCTYIVNAEIQEYLYKILKKNDENYTGDMEILSKIFSGENVSIQFSTENNRYIPENCALCILGNGFLDRFLIITPRSYRPMPKEQQIAQQSSTTIDIKDIYANYVHIDNTIFYFDENALKLYDNMETQFLTDLNNDLLHGRPTSKSKKPELIPKVAVALHTVEYFYNALFNEVEFTCLPEAISLQTLERAIMYVESIDEQKELFYTYITELVSTSKTPSVKRAPTSDEYKKAVLMTPGAFVTYRSFKQSTSKRFRGLLSQEFVKFLENFVNKDIGRLVSVRAVGSSKSSKVFVKKEFRDLPSEIKNWLQESEYETKRLAKHPVCITDRIIESINLEIH
ncbi:uncharacterized protein LOC130626079 isoform X2 [Hydractinia symbiolongicarpus]|uniref:uncharacterized protein LOC130626079 isoform X2 n=1 Tax=Hydractinia symbiolongicarpus TaxID=13093 RepID=UPI00254C496E|nr:uncharacterized protein LOC130626079 isoform X2 [Hydractinia symbiolongicarpus]